MTPWASPMWAIVIRYISALCSDYCFLSTTGEDMIYREIPGLDVKLPIITFGGASVSGEGGGYGFGKMSEAEAETLLKKAWDEGINLFDTAPIYGFGLSEERFGRYLPK